MPPATRWASRVALGVGHFTGSGYNDVAAIYGGDIEDLPERRARQLHRAAADPLTVANGIRLIHGRQQGRHSRPGDDVAIVEAGRGAADSSASGRSSPTATAASRRPLRPHPAARQRPSTPSAITLADLDADGFPDAVLGRSTTGRCTRRLQRWHGTMQPPSNLRPAVGTVERE